MDYLFPAKSGLTGPAVAVMIINRLVPFCSEHSSFGGALKGRIAKTYSCVRTRDFPKRPPTGRLKYFTKAMSLALIHCKNNIRDVCSFDDFLTS